MKGRMTTKGYLTTHEVAELLMVSPATVRQWVKKGELKALLTLGGHRHFLHGEVERFAQVNGFTLVPVGEQILRTRYVKEEVKCQYLELLEVPKQMLLDEIGKQDCIHTAKFCLSDQKCWGCDLGRECRTILKHDAESVEALQFSQLVTSMKTAKAYVEAKVRNQGHDHSTCFCDTCVWLRKVNKHFHSSGSYSQKRL